MDFFATDLEKYGVTGRNASEKIIVTQYVAEQENIELGDTITPYLFDSATETMQNYGEFEVVKIIQGDNNYIGAYIDWQAPAVE